VSPAGLDAQAISNFACETPYSMIEGKVTVYEFNSAKTARIGLSQSVVSFGRNDSSELDVPQRRLRRCGALALVLLFGDQRLLTRGRR
jgi:hypothetical protein